MEAVGGTDVNEVATEADAVEMMKQRHRSGQKLLS